MVRSAGVWGVSIGEVGNFGDATREVLVANTPYLIVANIGAGANPSGAGLWELPGLGLGAQVTCGRRRPQSQNAGSLAAVVQMAGRPAARSNFLQYRLLLLAARGRLRAARMEMAAARRI